MESMTLSTLLSMVFFGNSVEVYLIALGIVIITFFVGSFLKWFVVLRMQQFAERTTTPLDNLLTRIIDRMSWPVVLLTGIYLGAQVLALAPLIARGVWAIFLTTLVVYAIWVIQELLEFFFRRHLNETEIAGSRSALFGLLMVVKYALWVIGVLLVLSNLGMNITSLIAGLGVGGIAVAFALQNILEDLFSSFALYFDRPFEVGDFIVVGQQSGTVEHIGVKTTRLRALQGEQIVISNRELTTAQVQNFKKLEERRVALRFGVTYQTSAKQREAIPKMVQDIVEKMDGIRFSRVHLDDLGASALMYEVVYYVEDSSFDLHMERKQQFYFELMRIFERKKIAFAYPTQTVWVEKIV